MAHMDATWSAHSFGSALRALRLCVAGLLQCSCAVALPQETRPPCWTLLTWTRHGPHAASAVLCARCECAVCRCAGALPRDASLMLNAAHMDAIARAHLQWCSARAAIACAATVCATCRCAAALLRLRARRVAVSVLYRKRHVAHAGRCSHGRCSHGRNRAPRIFGGALRLRARRAVLLVRCSVAVLLLCRMRHTPTLDAAALTWTRLRRAHLWQCSACASTACAACRCAAALPQVTHRSLLTAAHMDAIACWTRSHAGHNRLLDAIACWAQLTWMHSRRAHLQWCFARAATARAATACAACRCAAALPRARPTGAATPAAAQAAFP